MPQIPQTRRSLLIQLGKQNDEAWAEFLQVYETAIVGFCRAMGLQDADARDATQEVLAAVHAKVPTWDHDAKRGSFRAWLFRVARNVAVDAIAARARRGNPGSPSEVERKLADLADPQSDHDQTLAVEYRRALLEWAARQAKAEVRETTWQAFELTAVREVSADEAAAQLGVSVGSVYTAKCRVVARIRERIAHLDAAFPDDLDAQALIAKRDNQPD